MTQTQAIHVKLHYSTAKKKRKNRIKHIGGLTSKIAKQFFFVSQFSRFLLLKIKKTKKLCRYNFIQLL